MISQIQYQELKKIIDNIYDDQEIDNLEKTNRLDLFLSELNDLQTQALAKLKICSLQLQTNNSIKLPEWLKNIDCSGWKISTNVKNTTTKLICNLLESAKNKYLNADVSNYYNDRCQVSWNKDESTRIDWIVGNLDSYSFPLINVRLIYFKHSLDLASENFNFAHRLIEKTLELLEE